MGPVRLLVHPALRRVRPRVCPRRLRVCPRRGYQPPTCSLRPWLPFSLSPPLYTSPPDVDLYTPTPPAVSSVLKFAPSVVTVFASCLVLILSKCVCRIILSRARTLKPNTTKTPVLAMRNSCFFISLSLDFCLWTERHQINIT